MYILLMKNPNTQKSKDFRRKNLNIPKTKDFQEKNLNTQRYQNLRGKNLNTQKNKEFHEPFPNIQENKHHCKKKLFIFYNKGHFFVLLDNEKLKKIRFVIEQKVRFNSQFKKSNSFLNTYFENKIFKDKTALIHKLKKFQKLRIYERYKRISNKSIYRFVSNASTYKLLSKLNNRIYIQLTKNRFIRVFFTGKNRNVCFLFSPKKTILKKKRKFQYVSYKKNKGTKKRKYFVYKNIKGKKIKGKNKYFVYKDKQGKKKKIIRKPTNLGILHILFRRRNIFCTLSDPKGNIYSTISMGLLKVKGRKRQALHNVKATGKRIVKNIFKHNIKILTLYHKGKSYRKKKQIFLNTIIRINQFEFLRIRRAASIPHNGCRPSKIRRK